MTNDLCITVRALKRWRYTKKCLESLEKNTDLDCDFAFYQDGAINKFSGERYATDEEVHRSLEVFTESKLNADVIYYPENKGGAIIKANQLKDLFPKYRYVMMIDNDLIFNKFYIKTIKTLFKQFEKSEAGILHTSYRHYPDTPIETYKYAKENEDKVAWGFSHRWEQGFWRSKIYEIKKHFKPFIQMTSNCDFMQIIKGCEELEDKIREIVYLYGKTGDDNALEISAEKAGLKGLHTLSLRHKTIGEGGQYTFDPIRWESENFDKIKLFNVGDVDRYVFAD